MRGYSVQPRRLNTGRLVWLFAVISVIFVLVLAIAPLRPYFAEWRSVQHRYNEAAAQSGGAPVPIAIQQVWRPELGVTDRCVTCHLGMGSAGAVAGDPLFAAHPPIPHDPQEFGCTVCHGGQGRATTTEAAHGFVSHWDEQLLIGPDQQAGCGTCHDRFPLVTRDTLRAGGGLLESFDCLSCHKSDGRGRGTGPDLSYVGLAGFDPDWHVKHLAKAATEGGEWSTNYGPIPDESLRRLNAFLETRVGAPRIVEAQAVAMEKGCLGCHRVGNRGGDEGPALDTVGRKPVGDLDFSGVRGEHTLAQYMLEHLRDPAGVVPGSLMPAQPLNDEELALLTSWILSLRSRTLDAQALPKERVRRVLLDEPLPPLEGPMAFGAYCTACHGPAGQGRQFANFEMRAPAIGTPDFLDVASDEFIHATLQTGRPGRRMPPLAAPGGSLSPEEAAAVVAHLRSLPPPPARFEDVERAASDPAAGEALYRSDCATCHGFSGEGTELGSPLATPDRRAPDLAAAYQAIVGGVKGTAMPAYRRYDAAALRSLLDYTLALPQVSGSRAVWTRATGDAAAGEPIYRGSCAGCHGDRGEGKDGPALGNAAFQAAATPEFIAMTVTRGRQGTPMPAFGSNNASYRRLSAAEILDVVAYVRTLDAAQPASGAETVAAAASHPSPY